MARPGRSRDRDRDRGRGKRAASAESDAEDDDDDLLVFDEASLGPPAGVCAPATAVGSAFFAAVFGGAGAAMAGPRSLAQFLGQVFGGAIGAFVAATMHKEEEQQNLRRLAHVALGAFVGASCGFVALPLDDEELGMGIITHAALTAFGAAGVALWTDKELVELLPETLEEFGFPVLARWVASAGRRAVLDGKGSPGAADDAASSESGGRKRIAETV
eukprot:TRINITY_DN14306_c0_g2_i1.p2 TRINITY_DN14306_c0_g2~~TRINITY_DN14306_c0_g2_i1.p2  ORF type:complete len:217 (+),score=56.92 TRINITY_DN14306_c0_g2_i1:264-914(+)